MIVQKSTLGLRCSVARDPSPRGIFALLSFKNFFLFPLMVILGFYGIQSIIGYLRFMDRYSQKFFTIGLISCLSYYLSYRFIFSKLKIQKIINRPSRIRLKFSHFALVFLAIYAAVIIYTAYTAKEVALFSAFRGARLEEIAEQREEFLRTRTGWEAALKYINALCTTSIIPYIISTLFYIRQKLRLPILGLFLFALMLTLEKSLVIMALFPLVVLFANQKARKQSMGTTVLLVAVLLAASYLALGGFRWSSSDTSADEFHLSSDYTILPQANTGILGFVVTRIVWIPYITAYDWLRFQDDVLGGKFTNGDSISIVSAITGDKYISLERGVFAYEWGQNVEGTGSANTVYFIDAYLNFGILGSILYSMVLAFLVRVILVSDNIPAKAAAFVPLFYLCFNSLTAVLSSGGLGMVLLIIFSLQPITEELSQKNEKHIGNRRLGLHRAEPRQRARNPRVFPDPV
jgi:oligosaccharide repeat unit polymerase